MLFLQRKWGAVKNIGHYDRYLTSCSYISVMHLLWKLVKLDPATPEPIRSLYSFSKLLGNISTILVLLVTNQVSSTIAWTLVSTNEYTCFHWVCYDHFCTNSSQRVSFSFSMIQILGRWYILFYKPREKGHVLHLNEAWILAGWKASIHSIVNTP